MELQDKIRLIDDLIRESSDYTIADYFETLYAIETIQPLKEAYMNTPKHYTEDDEIYIIANHEEQTVRQIARALGLEEAVVRNYGSRNSLAFAKSPYEMTKERQPRAAKPQKEGRTPGQYSNTGFLSTVQKYAS